MAEIIDLTACIAKGQILKVDDKEYEIKFTYRALRALEEIYGNVGKALDSLVNREKLYDDILNFLYASLGEKYKLKKTDIEEWISVSSAPMLYDVILSEIMSGMSLSGKDNTQQGEI